MAATERSRARVELRTASDERPANVTTAPARIPMATRASTRSFRALHGVRHAPGRSNIDAEGGRGQTRHLAQFCSDWRGRDWALQILQLIGLGVCEKLPHAPGRPSRAIP